MSASLLADLVEPAYCTYPDSFTTLGPEVADLADQIGYSPDPEQRMLLDLMYGANRDQTWSSFEFCVVCSRQNLKTGLFKMAAIADLFLFGDELVIWTAHLFDTTEGAFRDIKKLIDSNDMLSRRVKKITEGNGDEEIILLDGSMMQFNARGKSSGRGMTGSKVFLDEAFALQPVHMGALLPTLATIPGAQVRYGSSAGMPSSEVLRDLRDRGRKGDKELAYAEWSDQQPAVCKEPDCDHHRDAAGCCLDDRDRWRRSNPAMGRRISEGRIASFRRSMPPREFAREFLGWWEDPAELPLAINAEDWAALIVDKVDVSDAEGIAVCIEVSFDRAFAAIGVAMLLEDGRTFVEVVKHARGTSWVIKACESMRDLWAPLVWAIDGLSPAASLLPEFEAAGIEVTVMSTADVAQAFGRVIDAVEAKTFAHLDDQDLADAVAAGIPRPVGDGASAWGRRKSTVDISQLIAVTNAAWAMTEVGSPISVYFPWSEEQ